ncbi:ABC transporter permease [Bacillus cereus]|nr:ABC transporter permease [Bacillus cereus]PFK15736.1 ABC transporter permease [Bacillus cereus]PFP48369.1 ABC transporter permease [Bacillus cereus]PFV19869.1 ABC transporter permease [Bacillus cereus]PGK68342.1 ABC transporter permease [Bacillus cereus]
MKMLMKQLKLHINFHYKAILIFWIVALLIKGALNAAHLNELKISYLPEIINNPSIAIMMFIVVSTFNIQNDLFRLAISFGVTRIQYFIGAICYIVLQSALFSFLQVILLQDIKYNLGNVSIGEQLTQQFILQFLFYVTTACFFQVVVVFKQRFQWIGLMIGGTLFLSTNSLLYGEVGINGLLFTSDVSLIDIPYFTVISIGLTSLYIITSSIFIRKVSFE